MTSYWHLTNIHSSLLQLNRLGGISFSPFGVTPSFLFKGEKVK